MLGLQPGTLEMSEAGFFAHVHEDDHARLKAAMDAAAREGGDYTVEFRFRHASGEWRWMEARGRVVRRADGAPGTLSGIGIDTTVRRRAEDELRRQNAELLAGDRRKDDFLAVLAHELRNPLAPIKNSVAVLRAGPMPDPQSSWARDIIDRQVDRMARLLDDLLDVSRIARGRLELHVERVELAGIVDSALETSRPLIDGAGHELAVELPPHPVYLDADPGRIGQALENLLGNAAKYTERGGRIRLAASVEGRELVLSVRDSGIGLAEDQLASVFDMFAQTESTRERAQGGLGIGLALVKAIAKAHHGDVMAYSEGPGKGSEFMVTLPLGTPRMLERESAGAAAPASPERRRVLIADDNSDAAESLALMLQLGGHDVRTGRDGVEAVSIAESFRPHVAVLDIGMPRMNGYDAARAIRALPGADAVVLVALTGWGQDEDKRRAEEAGFDHHFTKPVDAAQLESLIVSSAANST